jgi:nucleotide-binding universal stress UspA family protein
MTPRQVPQPSPDRMVPVVGHPLVMGVVPGQPELVASTAAMWASAMGATKLYCAHVDVSRFVAEEYADGSVRHLPVDPDGADDVWQERSERITDHLSVALADSPIPWEFRYLAGRVDRALTHLARAVDASAFVIGTRAPRPGARMRELFEGSVAIRLSHHQHRPVLIVPLEVVDWQETHWA